MGCVSPAGPPASTLLPGNLLWTSSWACTQWCKRVIVTPRPAHPVRYLRSNLESRVQIPGRLPQRRMNWSSTTGRWPGRLALTSGASGLRLPENVGRCLQRQPCRSCVSPSSASPWVQWSQLSSSSRSSELGIAGTPRESSFPATAGHTLTLQLLKHGIKPT